MSLSSGKAVHYLCDESSDWFPDLDDIRAKITPRTRGIVIINPNNPTGAVYSKELLQEIVEIARQHNLIISPMKFTTRSSTTKPSITLLPPWRRTC